MSTYNPQVKIFYGPRDSDHRLIPAPDISISLEYNYSNDTIIGYSYIFNLNGVATALDLRDLENGDSIPQSPQYNLGAVADHIHKLRQILHQNGNILYIVDASDNILLKASGGILRSFSVDESPNNWIHFANYSASIEFHSVDLMSSTDTCGATFLDPSTFPSSNNSSIVNIDKYKIKSFQDSWNFTFDETTPYNRIKQIETGSNINLNNTSFNIQYSINATGKNFYTYDDPSNPKLLPAWEQAKNFVQYRLYYQVTNLINGVLKNSYSDGCTSSDGLDDLHTPGGSDGLLSNLTNYKIYNEEITCEASESDGSFSATYSAMVRSTIGNTNWSDPAATHSVNKSVKLTNNNGIVSTNISLNGTIQGLIEGGLIRINQPIQLPSTGSILITNNTSRTKYDNAKVVLDKIYSANDYNSGLGESGKRDIKKVFKDALGIDMIALGRGDIGEDPDRDPRTDAPHPVSFNLTQDYNGGNINYTIEYSSDNACGRKYSEVSIQTNQPTKVMAVFNIPNSESCPVIQELGTYTAKTVSITVQGSDLSDTGQPSTINLSSLIQCGSCFSDGYLPVSLPNNYILTQKQYTSNPVDGSYTISLGYTCKEGCSL